MNAVPKAKTSLGTGIEPRRNHGFLAMSPLAGALLSDRPQVSDRQMSLAEQQVAFSKILLDTIRDGADALPSFQEFNGLVLSEASVISTSRTEAAARASGERKTAQASTGALSEKPVDTDHALRLALAQISPGISITGSAPHSRDPELIIFNVKWGSMEFSIPLRQTVMEADDPVAEAAKTARALCEGWARAGSDCAPKASRPSFGHLGITAAELAARHLTYDGVQDLPQKHGAQSLFTYTGRGINTTFAVPVEDTGRALLDSLEGRIIAYHSEEGTIPFEASFLEAIAGPRTRPYLASTEEPLRTVAATLDYLVRSMKPRPQLVPDEYRAAYNDLNACQLPQPIRMNAREFATLRRALDTLEPEGLKEARGIRDRNMGPGGAVSPDTKQRMLAVLKEHDSDSLNVCPEALGILARAHLIVTGKRKLADRAPESLDLKAGVQIMNAVREAVDRFEQIGVIDPKAC